MGAIRAQRKQRIPCRLEVLWRSNLPFEGSDEWLNDWIAIVGRYNGDSAASAAERILAGARDLGLKAKKQSQEDRGFSIGVVVPGLAYWHDCTPAVAHDKRGSIAWEVSRLKKHKPFDSPPMAEQLWGRLKTIPGLDTSKQSYPDSYFKDLAEANGVERFLEVLEWIKEKANKFNSA
jgi:hypothetical protein